MGMGKRLYTHDDVASHRNASSAWVIVNNKVYDVTEFVNDHPGGADLVLQYAGKDATEIMTDVLSHTHSEAAYSMLEDFYLGDLDLTSSASLKPSAESTKASAEVPVGTATRKKFVDPTKPMLYQIFTGGYSKDYYIEQVHIPQHVKGGTSPPIFGHPALEVFTKTPWWVIPMVYIPIVITCLTIAVMNNLSVGAIVSWFAAGLLLWTFIEYSLHRFLFHVDEYLPDNTVCITLHFLLHGIHHYLPMDRMRLVMPPVLGLTLACPIYMGFIHFCGHIEGHALASGAFFGFMGYDLIHYYLHHGRPATEHLRTMKSYHLDHHYKNAHLGYGITTKLWDYVFDTVLV
ncbi:fatty acid alpha-hydroxylase [Chytridiales sp. JEL 0842]|nr:fatty acid alpha-hydroxylase [Chytridiales sp. JEL 0842]